MSKQLYSVGASNWHQLFINGRFIPLLIIFQCIILFIEGVAGELIGISVSRLHVFVDFIFLMEILIRIHHQGYYGFFRKFGNIFDFVLVFISLLIFILPTLSISTLTVLRVIRLVRVVKIFTLIPNFEQVIKGIVRAIKASRVVLIMLLLLVVFLSMLGFLLFKNTLPQFFSDPLISTYTVFSLFTVEGWSEIPASVPAGTLDYYIIRGYVILVIVLGSFLALSLANAIFIDEMVLDNNEGVQEALDKLIEKMDNQEAMICELKKELKDLKEK